MGVDAHARVRLRKGKREREETVSEKREKIERGERDWGDVRGTHEYGKS